tara:strand:+ start:77 stop:1072 length:996 start_codon:yes stop_codon:yes gene_type:complete
MNSKKKKLIFLTKLYKNDFEIIKKKLNKYYSFILPKNFTETELAKYIKYAEVAVGNNITKKIIDKANNLKFYQHTGTGIDHIDIDIFKNKNIIFSNTHSYSKYVAEYSISLMFALIKRIHNQDLLMRKKIWFHPKDYDITKNYLSDTIFNKKIGILGYGHIGKSIVDLLQGFNLKFYVLKKQPLQNKKNIIFSNLNKILKSCDIIFICLPLTKLTSKIINKSNYHLLNDKTYLINVARAELVDEFVLFDILKNNKIAGAAIDVWYNEKSNNFKNKLSDKYNFTNLDNILYSPHRAGFILNKSHHLEDVTNNLINYYQNKKISNIVNIKKAY